VYGLFYFYLLGCNLHFQRKTLSRPNEFLTGEMCSQDFISSVNIYLVLMNSNTAVNLGN
jgi:hypothetical protein